MSQDFGSFTWYDYDGEKSTMQVNTVEITELTLAAQVTALNNLRTALNDITLAVVSKSSVQDNLWDTKVVPTDQFAQRETKWVIIAQDSAGNLFKANEVPTADLSLLEAGSKYIIKNGVVSVSDPDGFVAAVKTAYEAVAVTQTGLSMTIMDMYQAGRNN